MKKLIFGLFLLFTSMVNGQTIIAYDNIETWDWLGGHGGHQLQLQDISTTYLYHQPIVYYLRYTKMVL